MLSSAVRYHLLVTRVAGLTAGMYRYRPHRHALEQVRSGDLSDEAQAAGLSQQVMGDAAAIVALSVDRTIALGSDGARGYRHALLEVGMVGERLQLSAGARKLRSCPVGAFYDDAAAELLAIDPEREWVIHFVTIGGEPAAP
jgi:SagB-type dehydrogenase family enzyme